MSIYIFFMIVVTILSYGISKINKKAGLIIPLLILFFISTFRNKCIGTDYETYINAFHFIRNAGHYTAFESGFIVLNKMIGSISENYVVYTFIINSIIFLLLYKFIKQYSCIYWLSILIFICNPYLYIQSTFNIVRQGIAMGIVALAVMFLGKNKKIKFLICIFIAALIHKSAIIFLLLIFIRNLTLKKSIITAIATIFIVLNFTGMSPKVISLFSQYLGYTSYNDFGSTLFDFKIYVAFIYLLILVLVHYYKNLYTNKIEQLYINIYIIGLISLLLLVSNDIGYRIYIYFSYISMAGIPILIKNFPLCITVKNRQISVMYLLYVSYFVFLFIMFVFSVRENMSYVPFKFCTF